MEKSKKRVCIGVSSGDVGDGGNEEDYGSQLRRRRRFRTMAIGNGGDGGGGPILVQTRSGVEYSFALHMDQA